MMAANVSFCRMHYSEDICPHPLCIKVEIFKLVSYGRSIAVELLYNLKAKKGEGTLSLSAVSHRVRHIADRNRTVQATLNLIGSQHLLSAIIGPLAQKCVMSKM